MLSGVFDQVHAQMQQGKVLGKFKNIPDVEAYRLTAEDMYKNNKLVIPSNNSTKASDVSNESVPQQEANADRNKKRKAAAPVKQVSSKKGPATDDFLGLSDEDFMKKYATP